MFILISSLKSLGDVSQIAGAQVQNQNHILHITGSLKFFVYKGGAAEMRVRRPFEIWVCNSESFMRIDAGDGPDAGPYHGFEVFCHANSVDTATIFDPSQFVTTAKVKVTKRMMIVTNQIITIAGSIPYGGNSHVTPVWFAYASQSQIPAMRNGKIKRFYTLSESEFELTNNYVNVVADWKGARIPSRVEFHSPGWFLIPVGNGKCIEKVCNKPYDHGYLDAIFEVRDYFDGVEVPKSFKLSFFGGVVGATENSQVRQVSGYQVDAESMEYVASAPVSFSSNSQPIKEIDRAPFEREQQSKNDTPSAFNSTALIYDKRVKDAANKPLHYMSTNGTLSPAGRQVVDILNDRNKRLASKRSQTHSFRRSLIIFFLVTIGIAIPIALCTRFTLKK